MSIFPKFILLSQTSLNFIILTTKSITNVCISVNFHNYQPNRNDYHPGLFPPATPWIYCPCCKIYLLKTQIWSRHDTYLLKLFQIFKIWVYICLCTDWLPNFNISISLMLPFPLLSIYIEIYFLKWAILPTDGVALDKLMCLHYFVVT